MADYPGRGLHGHVVDVIGGRIVGGAYAPGETLYPEEFEREFDVSKTVVREALKVLAAKGLVDSRQKRGTFVRPRADWSLLDAALLRWQGSGASNERFLADLAEVRSIIEPAAARLAARRRGDEDLDALEDAVSAMQAAGESAEATIAADLRFHRALLAAAHNELLSALEVVIEAGLHERDRLVHGGRHWPDSVPAHRAVLDAVRDGGPDEAAASVDALLVQAENDLRRTHGRS